ncbi:MAG: polysaccharide biosynthesis tyrosine autokinase [Alteromonadaceae bacterium]|nr:polysaccharide biosynthesis tyrosine autokinase [Alteromonadaceae bacterium]
MSVQTSTLAEKMKTPTPRLEDSNEIDLLALLGSLLDRKYFIAIITFLFTLAGISYAMLATPIYQATAMLQVEDGSASVPGFDDMAGLFDSASKSTTEIELLKSRSVIGEAVDSLHLTVVAKPKLFPVIGARAFRKFIPQEDGFLAEPKYGATSYAWGGEILDVFRFEVPNHSINSEFTLVTGANDKITLLNSDGVVLLTGKVGEELVKGKYKLTVRSLNARTGTEFILTKKYRLNTILDLQNKISASEKGKDSGIINLSYQHPKPKQAEAILNEIAGIYVRRNVERNSAEAKKSLDFLQVQLPQIKQDLEASEARFNEYQKNQKSINITLETQAVLEQIVDLETTLQELELKRLEMSRKFKREHPSYQGLLEQISTVINQKEQLAAKVNELPETQQKLLRLTRDVEVGNEIYMLLLGKTQELDIVRAGTVGNVRIVDFAEVNRTEAVKPKKALIVVLATMLGGMLAIVIVFIQKFMSKGVEDPAEIEAIGLSVYASVPFSDFQNKISGLYKFRKGRTKNTSKGKGILAVENPADLSIEALRSLRTSLHFAMLEAKNNIIAISGPSPTVGKSFISANLAVILAQSGKKVLLIDADMRKGYMQKLFDLKWEDGLSDYLSGRLPLAQTIKKSGVENLHIISRGMVPPNPSELLMQPRFAELVSKVTEFYDLILIDTPPVLAVTDAAIVGSHAGTMLLVTRFGQNHIREIELTRSRFEQNGVDVKGVVFNGVMKKASNAYGYYNYEYKSDK